MSYSRSRIGAGSAAKREVREDLKQQFGIPSDEEFFRWLGRYQEGR